MSQGIDTVGREHLALERLSALLDAELSAAERAGVERHLAACGVCRERLDGLRRTARRLASSAWEGPPPDLDLAVARRIAIERDRPRRLAQLEGALDVLRGPSPWLGVFAVVVALAALGYLLSHAVARGPSTGPGVTLVPLRPGAVAGASPDPAAGPELPGGHSGASGPAAASEPAPVDGELLQLAGRELVAVGGEWRERGLPADVGAAEPLPCADRERWSPADRAVAEAFCGLARPARLQVGDRVVLVLPEGAQAPR
jgi:hypothetical protein